MSSLNLLPPKNQQQIVAAEFGRAIQFFGTLAALILLTINGLLLPTYISLQSLARDRNEAILFEKKVAQELSLSETVEKLRQGDTLMELIRLYFDREARASSLIDTLFLAAGPVSLETIIVQKDGDLHLSGNAATRRDLLDFEKALRDSNRFQDILSPLTNIVQQRDIHFSIRSKIKEGGGL